MDRSKYTILVADDEELLRWSIKEIVSRKGYRVVVAANGREALEVYHRDHPDLSLLDIQMPELTGMEVLKQIMAEEPQALVVMISAYGQVERAVAACRLGAQDFVCKPFDNDDLLRRIERILEPVRLRHQVEGLLADQRQRYAIDQIVGQSESLREVFTLIRKVAATPNTTVLITGESGTGKDLVAKVIHHQSARAEQPMVEINCAAIPEHLLESELFGHEKGSFTGAGERKLGLVERANGGTLFLDEVGDMALDLQAKLLRLLENRTIRRVGGVDDLGVDLRVIAATNRDLSKRVEEGAFRADLYYRLNVLPIRLPALRERHGDAPLLVRFFLDRLNREMGKQVRTIGEDALACLSAYAWPGNVRELKNVIERAHILADGERIEVSDLPAEVRGGGAGGAPAGVATATAFGLPEQGIDLEEVERRLLTDALARTQGNQTQAAALLRLGRDALRYRMKKFGMLE
ncbi:MAG: DNA-binding response regulator [Nitrospirae bacterium CG_4_9_14_0_8_um_filter_70_14]|nr:MAG: DNA-binding response regulator [Nitrospirae bacterium CG_4_9_14_0_8_um_filter_70_14]